MKQLIKQYLKCGMMPPGTVGTWTSPKFTIKQKGKHRLICSYTKLNAKTVKFNHPLPNIEDIYAKVGQSVYFSVFDTFKGFHQVKLDPKTKHKAGIITPFGIYVWNVLPFGLCNGPGFFSRMMFEVTSDLDFVEVYVDDIIIHSKTIEEHF